MCEEKKELRLGLGIKESDFVIIYCGRLIEVKGVDKLLMAFNKINNPEFKLVVVGSSNFLGSAKTSFEIKLGELVKTNNIIFTGFINNAELNKYYQMADVQVIPSLCEEAAGLVSIEGAISGIPIIATKAGGLPEYCCPEGSLLIDRGDDIVDNIVNALNYIYDNKSKRIDIGKSNQEFAKRFTQKQLYLDFCDIMGV